MTIKTRENVGAKAKKPNWEAIKRSAIKYCTVCGSRRSYTNPFATCYYCKKKFCYDHIKWGGIHGAGQKVNDAVRDICEKCADELKHDFL